MNGIVKEGDSNTTPEREKWLRRLDAETQTLLQRDEAVFFRQNLSTPCVNGPRSAEGSRLTDLAGKTYLDFHGNSVHQVGYGCLDVVEAIVRQLRELPFSPRRYANAKAVELAERLCGYMPSGRHKALFTPSGSASISVALKIARKYTGRHKVIALWDAFHGANLDASSVGGEGLFRRSFGPLLPGCEHIMPYNSYRCVFGDCSACGLKCLDYLDYILDAEGDVGAVLMETIRSTDVHIPPHEYYARLRQLCDRHGALLILDEIPTALGRTGEMYAFLHYDIQPDILVLGKGLGGGIIPMSAVVARAEFDVAEDMALGHYTHEKSPVGSAAALAVIEHIEQHGLLARTQRLGKLFSEMLLSLKERFPLIGDVRSIGLLAGVELVRSRNSREKATKEATKVMYSCLEKGVSFKVSQGNVLTLSPPLIISEDDLLEAGDILAQALSEVTHGVKE